MHSLGCPRKTLIEDLIQSILCELNTNKCLGMRGKPLLTHHFAKMNSSRLSDPPPLSWDQFGLALEYLLRRPFIIKQPSTRYLKYTQVFKVCIQGLKSFQLWKMSYLASPCLIWESKRWLYSWTVICLALKKALSLKFKTLDLRCLGEL